jgi:chemotaxis methyl-accepting protein methylase
MPPAEPDRGREGIAGAVWHGARVRAPEIAFPLRRRAGLDLLPLRAARFRHVVFADGPSVIARQASLTADRRRTAPVVLDAEEAEFLPWLFQRAGLDADAYRPETLRRRLPACLRALRVGSPREARTVLERQPRLVCPAISAMMIGVSAFFRDPHVFAALRTDVLPALARRSALRVWSIGCSEGAELHSIGMLLAEAGALARTHLLGTDCRTDAITRARTGSFDALAVEHVPPALRERYFSATAGRWQIASELRARAQWRRADVLSVPEPGPWDMILCRNVAIYMKDHATARLWTTLRAALRPGGILVVGKAERPSQAPCLSAVAPCIYRRDAF